MMKTRSGVLWLLSALTITGPGCESVEREPGDETHFQACRTDADCKDAGNGATCERDRCTTPSQGAGGVFAGASSGGGTSGDASIDGNKSSAGGRTACHDGTQSRCSDGDGIGGVAGAMNVRGCRDYMRAGLGTIDCPDAEGDAAQAALVSFCQHVESVEVGFLYHEASTVCGGQLWSPPAVDGALNVDAVCARTLPEVLRTCADSLRPCERLPLCVDDGVYGCDQIRQECPGLSATACRSGFDSRPFEGRKELRDCLTAAPASEDCVAAFYRCVWGL